MGTFDHRTDAEKVRTDCHRDGSELQTAGRPVTGIALDIDKVRAEPISIVHAGPVQLAICPILQLMPTRGRAGRSTATALQDAGTELAGGNDDELEGWWPDLEPT